MPLTIPIAHDFICPWCWVALFQAKKLQAEFGVAIEWKGFELYPDGTDRPAPAAHAEQPANKPPVPTRLEFLLLADGLELPKIMRPYQMKTHNAHEALEYAKSEGKADEFAEVLYRAYWEKGREINRPGVLLELAEGVLTDLGALQQAIETREFADQIVDFDDNAYAAGVYNVPTFFVGEKRYAEQPYVVLQKAVQSIQ